MNKNMIKLGVAGAIAGAGSSYLLKGISWLMSKIGQYTPQISAKLANPQIDINVSSSISGVNTGLTGWISNALGITIPSSLVFQLGAAAVGGALVFMLGAYAAELLGLMKGSSKMKLTATIFIGNLIAGLILGSAAISLGFSMVNLAIAFAINAIVLAWLFVYVDEQLKLGLNPF